MQSNNVRPPQALCRRAITMSLQYGGMGTPILIGKLFSLNCSQGSHDYRNVCLDAGPGRYTPLLRGRCDLDPVLANITVLYAEQLPCTQVCIYTNGISVAAVIPVAVAVAVAVAVVEAVVEAVVVAVR